MPLFQALVGFLQVTDCLYRAASFLMAARDAREPLNLQDMWELCRSLFVYLVINCYSLVVPPPDLFP